MSRAPQVQFPSDPDAAYSGHKGKGYQVQMAETVTAPGEPGLRVVTVVKVETAAEQDADAVIPIIEELIEKGLKPEEIIADTAYGGDANWTFAAGKGIELIAPVGGSVPEKKDGADRAAAVVPILRFPDLAAQESMTHEYLLELELYPMEPVDTVKTGPFSLADFVSDVDGDILICPMGWAPMSVLHKGDDRVAAYFGRPACLACQRRGDCPVKIKATMAKLTYRHKEVRLAKRRAFQLTREYAERYRLRSGIEATNSQLKSMGGGKLRVRGYQSVKSKETMKALALNIKRLTAYLCPKSRKIKGYAS